MLVVSRASLRVVVVTGLCVLACRSTRGSVAPTTESSPTHDGVSSDPAVQPRDPGTDPPRAPETKIGPIRKASPFVFVPHPGVATLDRVAKTLRAAAIGPTSDLRVELGCAEGARVVDGVTTKKLPIGNEEASAAVVDPSAHWIAVELTAGRVAVFSRAQLKRLGMWDGRDPIALAPDLLVLRHECRWVGLDPGQPDRAPKVLADNVCGEVVHVDAAERRFSIAETNADAPGIRAIVRVGDDGEPARIELPAEPALASPAVSSDGKILCGIATDKGKSTLQCRVLEGGAFERVAQNVIGPLHFAADASRIAFAVGVADGALDLHVADFTQRFVRKLGRVHQHRFAFLPGGERLVAYEGGRGIVFELDSGFLVPFGGRDDDWVGIITLPGTHDMFLATRLRSKCADLVKVVLPRDS